VLAGLFRHQERSNEAGLKYFLLGAFSTGFLLYGIALIYGVTGTTRVADIGVFFAVNPAALTNAMTLAGVGLLSIGFLFKIAAAPFHMWTPDVYHGAPTPITAFMSAGPKAAAFAAFLRVFFLALPGLQEEWTTMLWVLAVLTMIVGNIIAIYQTNLKRMLAYSSIAHAGYALVGMVAANEIGVSGILFYMLAYTFMNLGAFAVLVLAGKKGEENLTLEGFAGFRLQATLSRGSDEHLPRLPDGNPPDSGLRRQVLHLRRRGQSRVHLAGHHRRPQLRRLPLLLSSGDGLHVLPGALGGLRLGENGDRRGHLDHLRHHRRSVSRSHSRDGDGNGEAGAVLAASADRTRKAPGPPRGFSRSVKGGVQSWR
jgi:hypothetical protein